MPRLDKQRRWLLGFAKRIVPWGWGKGGWRKKRGRNTSNTRQGGRRGTLKKEGWDVRSSVSVEKVKPVETPGDF